MADCAADHLHLCAQGCAWWHQARGRFGKFGYTSCISWQLMEFHVRGAGHLMSEARPLVHWFLSRVGKKEVTWLTAAKNEKNQTLIERVLQSCILPVCACVCVCQCHLGALRAPCKNHQLLQLQIQCNSKKYLKYRMKSFQEWACLSKNVKLHPG